MPWSAGVYTRGYTSWSADAGNNLPISASKFDTEDNDFAAGINNCLTKDGLSVPNAAITWTLSSGTVLTLQRSTTDGVIFQTGLSGRTNNPQLQVNGVDAVGVTLNLTYGTLTLGAGGTALVSVGTIGGVVINAPLSGRSFTVDGLSGTHSTQIADSATNLYNAGFLELPQNSQAGNYTCVLADSGKSVVLTGTGNTATIPANASVAYPGGTTLTFVGGVGGPNTIAIASDTLYWAGTGGTSGPRTLAALGVATAYKLTSTTWLISGVGLS